MSKIRIVNWLLTRKCNLKCDYCAIVKDYKSKPMYYPDMNYYHTHEMPGEKVIEVLKKMKAHNPDMFHIFYGGEPLLYKDLAKVIKFCNENQIYYTIISNNTPAVQPLIKKLYNEVGTIEGFSSSVDPVFNEDKTSDRVMKSIEGLKRLKEMQEQNIIKDPVAEITIMKQNVNHLEELLEILSSNNIYSSITFIDIAKNDWYDFSNINDENLLLKQSFELAKTLVNICNNDKLLVHMKNIIPQIYDILPSNMDCEIDKNLHNITIDADGSLRLCLRIKGFSVSKHINIENLFDQDNNLNSKIMEVIQEDKFAFCKLCNHTCLLMSKYIDQNEQDSGLLIHDDKRGIK